MQELMNKIMLSCRKATELTEKKQEKALANREKVQLFFHLKLCSGCSAYQKQSELISKALKSEAFLNLRRNELTHNKLSPARKQMILNMLRKEK